MEDLFEMLEINGLCKEWDIVVFAKGVILKEINQFLSSDRPGAATHRTSHRPSTIIFPLIMYQLLLLKHRKKGYFIQKIQYVSLMKLKRNCLK